MTLELRLEPAGISYRLYDQNGLAAGPLRYEAYPEGIPAHEALMQLIYEQPLLALPYRELHVYYTPTAVTLVPESLYDSAEGELWLTTMCPSEAGQRLLSYPLPEESKMLLGTFPEELVLLLQRHYLSIRYIPVYMPCVHEALEASRTEGLSRLLVLEGYERITIALASPSGLSFLNSYDFVRPEQEASRKDELSYYRSLVWQTLALSAEHCRIEEIQL